MSQVQDCPGIATKSINEKNASMFDCPRKTPKKALQRRLPLFLSTPQIFDTQATNPGFEKGKKR